jgi:diguanylate cyclase (GGDEF)-like protein
MDPTVRRQASLDEAAEAVIGMKPPKKSRILVVDDEKYNGDLLHRVLAQKGYDVATAANGQDALDQIERASPDLILLDIKMPVMNGLALCEHLRTNFLTRSIPIIFLTAHNTLADRLEGLRMGVDDYMGKPFELEEVNVRVESALQRRQWDLSSHPLTRLPGSPAIEEEVWQRLRIGSSFAFAYIDIDNFKAYNDTYGFEAGDRVIKQLAATLRTVINDPPRGQAFAGHVGGDDFVFLSGIEHMRCVMPKVADDFDAHRKEHYRTEDFERGTIRTKSRQGELRNFPLMSLSIAVISTATRRVLHYVRLVEVASELKHFIKTQDHAGKSLVFWDRRT